MRKLVRITLSLGFLALGSSPVASQTTQPRMAEMEEVEFEATVVDLSCKQVYDLGGDMHRQCSQVCADNGIPLGLLSEDGTFYLPVSAGMPGTGANELLRPHAEHTVRVKGRVLKGSGMNSIIIDRISM